MVSKYRITVNFSDKVLHDTILEKAAECNKKKSRYIEDMLWGELVDDVAKREGVVYKKMANEIEQSSETGIDPNVYDAMLRSNRRFQGAPIINEALGGNFAYLTGSAYPGINDYYREFTELITVNSQFQEISDKWPMHQLKENVNAIVRGIIKKNLVDLWSSPSMNNSSKNEEKRHEHDMILALVSKVEIRYVKFEDKKFIIEVLLSAYFIPFSSNYIVNVPLFNHLDILNVRYMRFRDVATKDWGVIYYRLIHLDTHKKTGLGGYFIGYRNVPTQLEKVKFNIEKIKQYDYGVLFSSAESLLEYIDEADLHHRQEPSEAKDNKNKLAILNLDKIIENEPNKKSHNNIIKYSNGFIKIHNDRDLAIINTTSLKLRHAEFNKIKKKTKD